MSSSSLDSINAMGTQPPFSSAQENGETLSKGKQVNGKDDPSNNKSKPTDCYLQEEGTLTLSQATTSGQNQQLRIYQTHDDPTEEIDESPFINPISFLNTMHQKLKTTAPPVYSFSHDPTTGQFYCQVHFCGQTYQNQTARPKKQQAKEEVASIAMRDLSLRMSEITALIRQELIRAHVAASQKAKFGGKNQSGNGVMMVQSRQTSQQIAPHPLELVPKSAQWYRKQVELATNGQPKRSCVMLLEFCQMHKLGQPVYSMRDDGRGNYLFDCTIAGRVFSPEIACWHKNDAKDHISSIAFNVLYGECCDREYREIVSRFPNVIPPPYPNSMAVYSTADGGYIATPGSLVPANHIYVQNNMIPSHSIPRTS
ncbi:26301_t:CDS:1 [Gigaspora margarita]|uniref:26301_t:CDS:1 n=1 Tax=Gigaspora margarita TaxID=4874 RepID=A0ABN7WAG4_GIGMA|nr:26301_t:CDS:1 [Gigaspora margarita]